MDRCETKLIHGFLHLAEPCWKLRSFWDAFRGVFRNAKVAHKRAIEKKDGVRCLKKEEYVA